jgi:histidine kinase
MIEAIRTRLGLKLFLSFLIVIVVGMGAAGFAARWATPRVFERHMGPLGRFPEMRRMMGGDPAVPLQGVVVMDFYDEFRASFGEALLLAVGAAGVAAILVSLILSRSIVAPLRLMMNASQRIAEGHYGDRLRVETPDELGQLAHRFNEMAARLQDVELRRIRLIGDVAHELRTPLTTIQGSMEGLIDGMLPATGATFEEVRLEARRLSRLVDDLQELSRVEAGAYSLELGPVDLGDLVRTVVKRLSPQFKDKGVHLQVGAPESPAFNAGAGTRVLADEDRIVQVLVNLVGNALQYTPEGGTVTIEVRPAGREARVSVRDTGAGIPPEHVSLIFDRFYRVDKSRSRLHGGSGVGLTIAKHLVEAHGGRIWAESEGEGKGSVLTFTLPVAD